MNYYLDSKAIQPPMDIGTDPEKRSMISCNYLLRTKTPLTSLLELDIMAILMQLSVYLSAHSGTNKLIVYGRRATIPTGAGPYVLITRTGGIEGKFTHDNRVQDSYTVQVMVYALSYDIGMGLAQEIYVGLNGRRNFTVG